MIRLGFRVVTVGIALSVIPVPASFGGEISWLPEATIHPRTLADPLESRLGLTYAPAPDHIDAALGAPVPILEFPVAGHPLLVVLEGGGFLRLHRDGSFFPVETFDGRFGLGIERGSGDFTGRFRVMHWSAHKADGDTSVSFREQTFSQEFVELEVARTWRTGVVYVRVGGSWHSVPRDRGFRAAAGGTWNLPGPLSPSFLSIHLAADPEREWRLDQSVLWGWRLGSGNRARVSLRGYRGNSPRGQYWKLGESYLGIDVQFIP